MALLAALPAVFVASLTTFFIGGTWYSPALFLKLWTEERRRHGETKAIITHNEMVLVWSLIYSLIGAAVTYTLLHGLTGGHPTLLDGVGLGIMLGGGVTGTCLGIQYGFAERGFTLLAIDAAYHIVQFVAYGIVIALWPW